ncbi:MAG TPA: hypothetical protein VHO46_11870 [Bacteroidales bacterium]|nr:hypothetical protein [Bacteroidales bacterium]
MKKFISTTLIIIVITTMASGQISATKETVLVRNAASYRKYSISTPYCSFLNFGEEKTNTHHYEFHFGYKLSPKDRIGIKVATWKMFAPMGLPMKEQLKFDENNFYPGRLRESGIGVTYQRMLWKGLFASLEILPQLKTYIDINDNKIGNGFKLYTSYHLGYQLSFFKNRIYIEPQIHCQYWPIDTNTPQAFKKMDNNWNNYFLFEPNLYIGLKF